MTELEPVARIDAEALKELEKHPEAAATVWSGKARNQFAKGAVPLVRLSSAQSAIAERDARIAELEAKLAEADALVEAQQHDFAQNNIRNAENAHRATAAEALLKEAGPIIETFAQIGDYVLAEAPAEATMWCAGHSCTGEHMAQVSLDYFRAARSLASKIGGWDGE